jgi:hypothetical protein
MMTLALCADLEPVDPWRTHASDEDLLQWTGYSPEELERAKAYLIRRGELVNTDLMLKDGNVTYELHLPRKSRLRKWAWLVRSRVEGIWVRDP